MVFSVYVRVTVCECMGLGSISMPHSSPGWRCLGIHRLHIVIRMNDITQLHNTYITHLRCLMLSFGILCIVDSTYWFMLSRMQWKRVKSRSVSNIAKVLDNHIMMSSHIHMHFNVSIYMS